MLKWFYLRKGLFLCALFSPGRQGRGFAASKFYWPGPHKMCIRDSIYPAYSLEEAKELQEKHGGFIKTMWCGEEACELKMKDVAGMSSRCIPFRQEHLGDVCPICGKPANKMIYWGVAY